LFSRRHGDGSNIISHRGPVHRFERSNGIDDVGVVCVL